MKFLILLLTISYSYASVNKLDINDYPHLYPFDTELYERVLDPELCQRQLNYLYNDDPFLLLNFLDAGPKIPTGFLGGNLRSFGNYDQCLGISKTVDDLSIEGKYCKINIPLNISLSNYEFKWPAQLPFDVSGWSYYFNILKTGKYYEYINEHGVKQSSLKKYLSYVPYAEDPSLRLAGTAGLPGTGLQLALCIPKACTTNEAINSIVNFTALGFQYQDVMCRLPNDKPWVTADYIAIVIFSILGLLIVISTVYDLYHLYILNKSPKDPNILRLFSGYSNISMLMDISNKPGSLQCLDGIRAFAILWVVLGHTFVPLITVVTNLMDALKWATSLKAIWVTAAPLTVDTFFMLSGLLVVYVSMAKYTKIGLLKNLHVFYLNRLLRMLPMLAIMVLFEASFLNRVADGPFWESAASSVHMCRAFWWTTLLHLQNFIVPMGNCLPVTWYLAIDVQLHILSPIVLFWLLQGSKRSAWAALVIAFLISITIATCYLFLTDIHENFFVYFYVNILTRSPPFFVGMIVGYFLRIYRDVEFKMSPILSASITLLSLGMMWVVTYVNFLKDYGDWNNTAYSNIVDAFSRSVWAAVLGWIVFICVNGHGGPINWILSLRIWRILARISYAMYVFHFSMLMAYHGSVNDLLQFTVGSTVFRFISFTMITIFISILLTGLIDVPCAFIFKTILEKVTVPFEKPQTRSKDTPKTLERANGHVNEGFVDDSGRSRKQNVEL